MTGTLTFVEGRDSGQSQRRVAFAPQLVLIFDCADPRARPARFSLADVDEVHVGRGPQRRRVRVLEGETRRLRIHLPDDFMSSKHVRLVRTDRGWRAEDAGSKNGTLLGEASLDRAELTDGDLLTTGNSIFVYRDHMGAFEGEADVDLGGVALADAPVTTLHIGLAQDLARLRRVAASPVPILVHGETGTGKELAARAVHAESGRSGPFVAVNCGALPKSLVSSELFGARKGAYSGATESRRGLVRSAHQGTLFLDEVAELPLEAQVALLRVLQEGEVLAVGSDAPTKVDIKVVAATHRNLSALVEDGTFREDLYGRIAGHTLTLPPLRERREDIGLVIGTLLERASLGAVRFVPSAARALFEHAWPRNVRELDHALSAALAMAGEAPIALEHLPASVRAPALAPGSPSEAGGFAALALAHRGNVSAIARALDTSRSQVRRVASKLGVDLTALRGDGG